MHASLKRGYANPGDRMECLVGGFVVDVVHLDFPLRQISEAGAGYMGAEEPIFIRSLTEIQTGNFGGMRRKLEKLLPDYPIRVVYPLATERRILRIDNRGTVISRRKSPYQASLRNLFYELVSLARLALHPNFSLEVALIVEEQVWRDDGQGSWRRKHWSLADRRLLELRQQVIFRQAEDYLALLPPGLPDTFGSQTLAAAMEKRGGARFVRRLAGKMLYCLREMGLVEVIGKQGKAYLYKIK